MNASWPWWLRAPMRHIGVMAVSERGDQSKCHLDWSGLARQCPAMRGPNPCSHRLGETTNPSAFIGQRGTESWDWGRQAGAVKAGGRQCPRISQKERGSFHRIPSGCRRPQPSERGRPSKQVSTLTKRSSCGTPTKTLAPHETGMMKHPFRTTHHRKHNSLRQP